jgi:uncharacterized protein (DUF433 family)
VYTNERIACYPDIMLGKSVIKGTRITVELLLKKLSEGMSIAELITVYPQLRQEDILAAISFSG